MDIELKAYIPTQMLAKTLGAFRSLPNPLRPGRFSADEHERNAREIPQLQDIERIMVNNRYGFFMFSPRLRYNVMIRPADEFSRLLIDTRGQAISEKDAIEVLRTAADAGSRFALAADPGEYDHRNLYVREMDGGKFEAWVGRDLQRYLPGMYWMTFISSKDEDVLPKPATALAKCAEITKLGSGGWLVRAFPHPQEWKIYADDLDRWCLDHPRFFSKGRISSELDAAPSAADLSKLAAKSP